jgi:crotonobetainyl-CoA:carnitine CoA-transferase CaiB-like acyl-CoA transferase
LVPRFDVLVEGFRPGVLARLGFTDEDLRALHPGLIHCSITGYGQKGPLADRAGHDINYLARSGVLGITGARTGDLAVPGVQIGDLGGGAQSAACAILAALVRRLLHGQGARLDVSMTDGLVSWLSMHAGEFFATGTVPGPAAMTLNGAFPCYRLYRCADGWMALGALEPKFWRAFCGAVGREDLVSEQFSRAASVHQEVEALFAPLSRAQWEERLAGQEVCCEPVLDFAEAFGQPLALDRRWRRPGSQGTDQLRPPVEIEGMRPLGPAPRLGEHNAEILAQVGYDPDAAMALGRA